MTSIGLLPLRRKDLQRIEQKMAEVVARDEKFVREQEPREQGLGGVQGE